MFAVLSKCCYITALVILLCTTTTNTFSQVLLSATTSEDTAHTVLVAEDREACATGAESIAPYNESYEQELLALINQTRVAAGLSPLKKNNNLVRAARYHAKHMCDNTYFNHNSLDVNDQTICTTFQRIGAFYSYQTAAENIAAGTTTPQQTHDAFMASPGHLANIMNPNVREVGVGYYYSANAPYFTRWVEDFGAQSGVYPVIINQDALTTDAPQVNVFFHGQGVYSQLRIKNSDTANWGDWQNFTANLPWVLTSSTGSKTVEVQMRVNANTNPYSNSDQIDLISSDVQVSNGASVNAKIKVFLQGAYSTQTANMKTELINNNLLPLQQPFNVAPWNYNGNEELEFVSDFPPNAVDWVLVEARDATDPSIVIERRVGLLLNNGSVVDYQSDIDAVRFYDITPSTAYYLSIRTHGHLSIVSKTPILLPNSVAFDMTKTTNVMDGATQLISIGNNGFAMRAGDLNGDGVITVADFNDYTRDSASINEYIASDCSYDGAVTVSDFNLYLPNSSVIGVYLIRD